MIDNINKKNKYFDIEIQDRTLRSLMNFWKVPIKFLDKTFNKEKLYNGEKIHSHDQETVVVKTTFQFLKGLVYGFWFKATAT